ncbi:MAG TPA: DNRLRE domain-containing protein [Polyangiaceae bacterium]
MSFRTSLQVASGTIVLALASAGCGAAFDESIAEEELAATTYQVGPGKPYANLQAVASLLNPGDTVQVYGGTTYSGDIRLTRSGNASNKIKIVGVRVNGARPKLSGGTNTIELAGNHTVFEGFEVTGGSMRCVYHHAHEITIRDSVIHDCPSHGILGADSGSGSLTLEYSEVYRSGSGDTRHQIYMATDESMYQGAVFRMRHNYVHDGNGGNNVKSRAERNEIDYNWIEGAYYHELELIGPDGQDEGLKREDSDVVGNVLYQRFPTRSHYAVRIGGDGTGQTWGRFRFMNNTIIMGEASTAAAFRVFDGIESAEFHGNALYRQGGGAVTVLKDTDASWLNGRVLTGSNNWTTSGSTSVPSTWTNTRQGSSPGFVDVAGGDLRLSSSSPLRDAGISNPPSPSGHAFPSPETSARYEPPRHVIAALDAAVTRVLSGTVDIGAYEYGSSGTPTPVPTTPPPQPTTPPPVPTTPPPPPPAGTAVTLTPIEDGYVRGGTYAATNFGAASELEVQSNSDLSLTRDAYLRFDLGSLASVSSAKFRVSARLSGSASVGVTVFPAPGAWSETALVWNLRPGFVSGSPLATFTLGSTSASSIEADVTAYVKSERQAGRRLVSFALHSLTPSTQRAILSSREASANRPALIVTP